MLTTRTIASGWRVVDPTGEGLCSGGGQILAPLTFTTGQVIAPLAKSLNDRTECPVCGHVVAVIADFDGDSISPHRVTGGAVAVPAMQLGLFDV